MAEDGIEARVGTRIDHVRDALDEAMPWGGATAALVVAVTLLALAARLFALGWRVMHWDEVRVAYWILRWTRTGQFQYQPHLHGPLVQQVNHWLYALLGTSNFVSRLPVALVGGLLPAAALLFRERLSDRTTVGVAVALALNPLLLYYSRFMRSDVLVAGFMVVALGFVVRLWDTRRPRHLYLAVAFGALGFASKENAVLYVVCWLGMVAAVGGLELLYPRRFASRGAFLGAIRSRVGARRDSLTLATVRPWGLHGVGAVVLFVATTVWFYAPRGTDDGLWTGNVLGTLDATLAGVVSGFERWGGTGIADCWTTREYFLLDMLESGTDPYNYVCNVGLEVGYLVEAAPVLLALSVIGLAAAWRSDDPGVLVPGAFMWGVASILGYAAGTDIIFPSWLAVHAVVAFAFPAGAGLALLWRWSRESMADEDLLGALVAGGLAVLLVTAMGGVAVQHAYAQPYGTDESTSIVQFAQPGGELGPALETIRHTVDTNDGVDVLAYGTDVVDMRTGGTFEHPACVRWLSPLSAISWTLYRSQASVECVDDEGNLSTTVERTDPPVVLSSVNQSDVVDAALDEDYVSGTYRMYRSEAPDQTVVIYFDTAQVEDPPTGRTAGG